MEDVKDEEELLKRDKQMFLRQVKKLRTEKDKYLEENSNLRHCEKMVENLVRQGYINENGVPTNKK